MLDLSFICPFYHFSTIQYNHSLLFIYSFSFTQFIHISIHCFIFIPYSNAFIYSFVHSFIHLFTYSFFCTAEPQIANTWLKERIYLLLAIAQVCKEEGNSAYKKKEFPRAVDFYTKDWRRNAKMTNWMPNCITTGQRPISTWVGVWKCF